MNSSNIPTNEKVMITLRIPPDTYSAMVQEVRDKKDNIDRNFSINQYITDLLEEKLGISRF